MIRTIPNASFILAVSLYSKRKVTYDAATNAVKKCL